MEEKVVIGDEFWDNFVLMSKVCLLRDKEATIYDVFDTLRTRLMGGTDFSPELIAKLDAEIEAEENGTKRVIRRG